MGQTFLRFHDITFEFDSAPEALFTHLSLHLTRGWCGVVGANGCGKTTLLQLAAGILRPTQGRMELPHSRYYCSQRTDHMPEELKGLCLERSSLANRTRARLGIGAGWHRRWPSLSHGERKRAQIGVALWREPRLLAIDEPTNHLDGKIRDIIAAALKSYGGVGLLVSHDRELLDDLCQGILFIDPPQVVHRPGSYTQGALGIQQEKNARLKQRTVKKQALAKLKGEALQRRRLAGQHGTKRSKRGMARKDHDAREKVDRARISNKDVVGGKLLRQMAGRLRKAQKELDAIPVKREAPLGIWMPGEVSQRDTLLRLGAGRLSLGGDKQLQIPGLNLNPQDRIAVTGENGAGKTTLINHLVAHLTLPADRLTYLPQEIEAAKARELHHQVRGLPPDQLGHLMTIVSRLGSVPERLLGSRLPSPGEVRKLMLALGMLRRPHLVIMDEPTNHMDLPSIECLENALAACPGCLVLVSHDRRFLSALTEKRWHLAPVGGSQRDYRLAVE